MKLSLINKTWILAFYFLSFFLLTDFALYYFPQLKIIYWMFLALFFVLSVLYAKRIDKTAVLYFLLFVVGVSISFLAGKGTNGALLVPLFSYMCFHIQNREGGNLSLFSNIIVIFLILFSLTELFVKLNFVQIPWMYTYLAESGAKRIDVLRLRGPFGSPLSLASLAVYLVFYSVIVHKNLFCLYGSMGVILLSGSRTAFIISIFMLLSTVSAKKIIKQLPRIIFIITIAACVISYYANAFGLTHILDRLISLESYNVARDESFLGRSNTTLYTASLIFKTMPRTLFLPLDSQYVSDSAIISLIAGSGLFLVGNFIVFLLRKIAYLDVKPRIRLLFVFAVFLMACMVGDAFVPAASFYLYTVLFYKGAS
jgi:hypothetical protein